MRNILKTFLIPLIGDSFNEEWIEEWDNNIVVCQLWSEDWIGCKIENKKVVKAIILRSEARDVIRNGEMDCYNFSVFEDILNGQTLVLEYCDEDVDKSWQDTMIDLLK